VILRFFLLLATRAHMPMMTTTKNITTMLMTMMLR